MGRSALRAIAYGAARSAGLIGRALCALTANTERRRDNVSPPFLSSLILRRYRWIFRLVGWLGLDVLDGQFNAFDFRLGGGEE